MCRKVVAANIYLCIVLLSAFGGANAVVAGENVTIGTGGVTGIYYPAGRAICRLVNKNRKNHGIRCSVESTKGSVYNLNTVRMGKLAMGVAQSDWEFHAYNGSGAFAEVGPSQDLRTLFSIHVEPFTGRAKG